MTPKQFDILKKSTYGVLAATLGVSVFWLSSGGNAFQSSIVTSNAKGDIAAAFETTTVHSAPTDQAIVTDNFLSTEGTAEALTQDLAADSTVVLAQAVTTPVDTRSTISNEMATYRQTMTQSQVALPATTQAQASLASPTPTAVPTTGPSEVVFFLLSALGAGGFYFWHKKAEQK